MPLLRLSLSSFSSANFPNLVDWVSAAYYCHHTIITVNIVIIVNTTTFKAQLQRRIESKRSCKQGGSFSRFSSNAPLISFYGELKPWAKGLRNQCWIWKMQPFKYVCCLIYNEPIGHQEANYLRHCTTTLKNKCEYSQSYFRTGAIFCIFKTGSWSRCVKTNTCNT